MAPTNTGDRLAALRELMTRENIDVYVIPSEDCHSSEYISNSDARRAYISGFTGSAGYVVVSQKSAALSTDGRYFNQAEHQLDSNWELLKEGTLNVLTWEEWAAKEVNPGKYVGVDATLITAELAKSLESRIKKKGGAGLIGLNKNIVDEVWGSSRPERPNNPVMVLPIEYSGQSFLEKVAALRKELEKKKCPGFVVSMLDEIAWLYNLRGTDVPYNPVFFAYSFITPTTATLYVDPKKLTQSVLDHLGDSVTVRPYEEIYFDLTVHAQKYQIENAEIPEDLREKWLVSNKTSWALCQALGGEKWVQSARSPVGDVKAVKNETEREGMRQSHIRDGVSLIKYFSWLEERLKDGLEMDEVQAADRLEEFRKENDKFMGLSFDTISSTGPNAAVIHYKPLPESCSKIDPKAVYLCDSGAQYLDGTTDTTRTVHYGEPTEMEKKAYTLVLKGMIALGRSIFPKGTTGFALDILARQFLWNEGLNYRHGTGHGVGSFLNVHEGPIGIGARPQYAEVSLKPGMVLSDEPGYYEDEKFGIRIENIVMVKEAKTNHQFGDRPYYTFEHVTMVPMCKVLTEASLLADPEKTWLNNYHAEVFEKTKGFLDEDSYAVEWLKRETAPI